MFFELDKAAEGDWFPYFKSHFDTSSGEIIFEDPEPDAAEFCIRSMTPFFEERLKKRKKEHKMVLNPTTRAMERVSWFGDLSPEESIKENAEAWDYAITGMKNAYASEGVKLECNAETKLKLVKIPEFNRFVQRVFAILNGEAKGRAEAEQKN